MIKLILHSRKKKHITSKKAYPLTVQRFLKSSLSGYTNRCLNTYNRLKDSKKNDGKKNYSKLNRKIHKGGRYLGEGSFGCVVTPSIYCPNSRINTKKYSGISSTFREPVSKLIKYADEQVDTEITIANILKKIDPKQKYFLYVIDNCKIQKVPKNRSNVASVRFIDDELSSFRKLENKKLDKNYCDIDLSLNPINLIIPDGGYDFQNIIEAYNNQKYKDTQEYKVCKLFITDFKNQFRYLLNGLYKLHQIRIVNRDIKKENLMIDWDNKDKTQVRIKYIDFGLSEILTSKYCSSIHNIHAQGTAEFISPEIIIASILRDNYNYNHDYLINKITKQMRDTTIKICKELKLDYSNLEEVNKKILFSMLDDFKNKTILPKYFGTDENKFNGYVQKTDVYALGLTIYEVIQEYSKDSKLKKNLKLMNLLKNMIEFDPEKRLNILQCIQHPYFK
jgi:serine/threonine protein kinase